jgi:hypothetical protein
MSRTIAILPVVYALVGAGCGVCFAMLLWQEPVERAHVFLDDSVHLALPGLVAGALAGVAASAACSRWPGAAPGVSMASTALLGASIAAPLGWIVGDLLDGRFAREGMAVGALVGFCLGLVFAAAQARQDGRRRTPDARPTD